MKKIIRGMTFSLVLVISYFLLNNNGAVKSEKRDSNSILSFNICDSDGVNCSESTSVPIGSYVIDEEKTYCEGGGKVSAYNSTLGTIKYTIKGNDECKIYFKKAITNLSEIILAKESTKDYTSSQDGSIYRVVNQNGVRYEGKDPDNYVEYNGESWRIIGTFNGEDVGLETDKKYTKIIYDGELMSASWDCTDELLLDDGTCNYMMGDTSGTTNDWVNSSLHSYLNNNYLNNLSNESQGQIAKYNNNYSTWYLLGVVDAATSYYASEWYDLERSTGYIPYEIIIDANTGRETESYFSPSVASAIGLMYPSDYGYAAYGEQCNNESTETLDNYNVCGTLDWLVLTPFEGSEVITEWTITPESLHSACAVGSSIYDGFLIYSGNDVTEVRVIRPTLYLAYDVEITGGNGSKNNAFKVS
ncbi:MAG: hypothetical protein E7167_06050 [Firmicutes bacterium]|nr:hypothetical protein [Bacillota bacterium]